MVLESTLLPIVPFLPRISSELERHRALALTAEPGAGKSTLVPPYLVGQSWLAGRRIMMLEPRRVAAAAVAARIAEILGEPLGMRAGYRVRSASRVSRQTVIEVVTEALLTRAIQADPLLEGVGLLIFDEFHERTLHADLSLALALEVRRARPDLALLAMSATLETDRLRAVLGGAPAIAVPGRSFPVETRYWPLGGAGRWEDELADRVARLASEGSGDILVFLPGIREIERVASLLAAAGGREVAALHGSLPLERQREVLRPRGDGAPPRIILATSVAETSLTVPGVQVVADSGWARTSRLHRRTGLERLVTERLSASAAEQRRGRAGRLGPGICVRFWKESEQLPPRPDPEILRADLAGLVLECAIWGAREPSVLKWLDPPPESAWAAGRELDRMLGLLDREGRPTPDGRAAAALGLGPRLAVLALEGARSGQRQLAARLAALLQERDGSGLGRDPDVEARLQLLRGGGGSPAWRRAVQAEERRILGRLGPMAEGETTGIGPAAPAARADGRDAGPGIGRLLARAFPDRVARREPDGLYRFASGRVARWPVPTPGPAWVVAPDASAGETTGSIRLAAPLGPPEVEQALAPIIEQDVSVSWEGLEPRVRAVRRAGRLVLAERPIPRRSSPGGKAGPEGPDVRARILESFSERLARDGAEILPWTDASRALLARLRFFEAHGGPRLPALTDAAWLEPFLELSGGPILDARALLRALDSLPARHRSQLERSVPAILELPGGRRCRIDYSEAAPTVEARIQEVFGLAVSPEICGVKLVFRLLSPARRPLQVTSDLASFWRTTYAEIRGQMRGRYPRHRWPEDPMQEAGPRRPR